MKHPKLAFTGVATLAVGLALSTIQLTTFLAVGEILCGAGLIMFFAGVFG